MHRIDSTPEPIRGLAELDLNLLVVLDALLATGSATAAARLLGKTQSTISHALDRLRGALGDPILVRVGRGLAPTPRAQTLAVPLRAWLTAGSELVRGSSTFDPATLRTTFTVIAADYAESVIVPRLIPSLRRAAPGVTLAIVTRGDAAERAIIEGHADLFVGTFIRELDGLVTQTLYDDRFVTVVARGHRLARGRLTLARYLAAAHVLVSPRELPGGIVDDRLAARSLRRSIAVRTTSFAAAATLVATTDLIATLPASFARADPRLVVRDVPLALPGFAMQQLYRVSRRGDAALAWLRARIHDACAPLRR